jgi:hypothetical protein
LALDAAPKTRGTKKSATACRCKKLRRHNEAVQKNVDEELYDKFGRMRSILSLTTKDIPARFVERSYTSIQSPATKAYSTESGGRKTECEENMEGIVVVPVKPHR